MATNYKENFSDAPCQLCGEEIGDISKGREILPWGSTCGACVADIEKVGE